MKIKTCLLLFAITVFFGCQQNNMTTQATNPAIKKGMIKMAIMYPSEEGSTFDMDYYSQKHMPMASDLMGETLKAMIIDKGLGGGGPDAPATYSAIGYFYFENMEAFQSAMGEHSETLRADVPNYTNVKPIIQVSEVITAE